MIDFALDEGSSILHVRPTGPLSREDFDALAKAVDPFIKRGGKLAGLILEADKFPGWEDPGAALKHFRFIHDHHRKIAKLAMVTDSTLGKLAERLGAHFISAEIKRFAAGELDAAKKWIAAK